MNIIDSWTKNTLPFSNRKCVKVNASWEWYRNKNRMIRMWMTSIILPALSTSWQHKLLEFSFYNFHFFSHLAFEGQPIRCFECNSSIDPRCAEKMVPAYLSVDCSKTPEAQKGIKHTICRKTLQFVEIPVNGSKCRRCQRKTDIQSNRFIAFIPSLSQWIGRNVWFGRAAGLTASIHTTATRSLVSVGAKTCARAHPTIATVPPQ